VEFRLDSLDGRVIGAAPIKSTGGKTNYTVQSGPVEKVHGIHDLFIVARGEDGNPAGHLFNINWFTFTLNP
jgi:alpha-galactosidase